MNTAQTALDCTPVRCQVSVIVVSYNTRVWLRRCLSAITEASENHDLEIIVVDNASVDGSASMLVTDFPSIKLIENDVNLGFAKAVNQGASVAEGAYILLLNPDGYLMRGSIDALVDFASFHPEFIIFGGRTIDEKGALDRRSCWAAPTMWSLFCDTFLLSSLLPHSKLFVREAMLDFDRDRPKQVDIVTGCLLLISRTDWEMLGGLDETYFVYGEDADLCLRASTTGRHCAITPDAVMVHAVGASSDATPEHHVLVMAGRITLLRSRWTPLRGMAGQALVVLGVLLRSILSRTLFDGGEYWQEVWQRRRQWWRGYPLANDKAGKEAALVGHQTTSPRRGRFMSREKIHKAAMGARSIIDPRSWLHLLRLMHYYHYTYVGQFGRLTKGEDTRLAPNVSLANADRITLGARTNIGARCSLWAGDKSAQIFIGDDVRLGPNCFLTAANYGTEPGLTFYSQPKFEDNIVIGNGVWLGTGVVILPGVAIGDNTIVAAGAVVTQSLPGNVIAGGVPARVLRER